MILLLLAVPAFAFDAEAWQRVLSTWTDAAGRVDYAAIATETTLDAWVESLAAAPEPPAGPARSAFWINAYNALTVDLIADSWPVASIRDLDGGKVWDTRRFAVAGRTLTLNQIEHGILRPLGDPRVHAALNCASLGCPPLARTAFTGAGLDQELDAATRRWLSTNGIQVDPARRTVSLNQIFDWYGEDFQAGAKVDLPGVDGEAEWAVAFALAHLPPGATADFLRAGGYAVKWTPYSWEVNSN